MINRRKGRARTAESNREKGARKESAFVWAKDVRLEFMHHTRTKLKQEKIYLRAITLALWMLVLLLEL